MSTQPSASEEFGSPMQAIMLLFIVSVVASIYNFKLPLHPDEAYYFAMANHLQHSYFDHPPLTAWLIHVFTLWQHSEFWVRLPAVLCMSLGGYQLYAFAKELFNERVGMFALITYALLPSVQVAYTIITPDSFLLCFWILTTRFAWRYFNTNHWSDAIFMGMFAGLAMLSKYTAVLLLVALFLLMLRQSDLRKRLLSFPPYVALLLAAVIFSPVIYWNATHAWEPFLFQLNHGLGQLSWSTGWTYAYLGRFAAHQLGIFHPIIFFVMIWALCKWPGKMRQDLRIQTLIWPMVFTLLFFFVAALRGSPELNWTGPAYLTGIIIFAWAIETYELSKTFALCMLVSLAFNLCFRVEFVSRRLPIAWQPVAQFKWYKPAVLKLHEELLKGKGHGLNQPIVAQGYQAVSEILYYMPDHPRVLIYPAGRKTSFDDWQPKSLNKWLKAHDIKELWFIGESLGPMSLVNFCGKIQQEPTFTYTDTYTKRQLWLWGCGVRQPKAHKELAAPSKGSSPRKKK